MTRIYTGSDNWQPSAKAETPWMDDRRVSLTIRALRVRRGWRQGDLGLRAGVSRQLVTKVESGRLESVSIRGLRQIVAALGGSAEIVIKSPGGESDRAVNAGHAAMHETLARQFRELPGWTTAPEVTFSIYGERGAIDMLGWHAKSRTLLIVELKTSLVDINDLMASMDRRRRLAARIAFDRGWNPVQVGLWVAVADTSTSHRRLAAHAAVLRSAFPADGRAIGAWLRRPTGSIASLSFLSAATADGRRRDFRPVRQVRTSGRAPSTHNQRGTARSLPREGAHAP